ncbi:MAG TPA: hypothetical protein VGR06_01325 [Actinophytocola sp.]|jgi:hypothetical protein|uniref:hypothetical protein n=1 Tax=Actinophytocola sp. TaxID=1872138 RepID=UPI002E008817|nr:hypothetical protein [Actinophytocola sp.]
MNFHGVDHPGQNTVWSQGIAHGEQHLGTVPLNDHAIVLCVHNAGGDTIAVRIETWNSNDSGSTDFNAYPGDHLCVKIADLPGDQADVRITASGGEIEYEICQYL